MAEQYISCLIDTRCSGKDHLINCFLSPKLILATSWVKPGSEGYIFSHCQIREEIEGNRGEKKSKILNYYIMRDCPLFSFLFCPVVEN